MNDAIFVDVLLISGAVAWITTTMVYKDGPFGIVRRIREWFGRTLGTNSPFGCPHCTSFWVTLVVVALYLYGAEMLVRLFGVMGLAQSLRSGEE